MSVLGHVQTPQGRLGAGLLSPSADISPQRHSLVKQWWAKSTPNIQRVLADPAFKQRFLGPSQVVPVTGSPAEFAAFVRADGERWGKVIKDAGIKVE